MREREERLQLLQTLDKKQEELHALTASLFTAHEEERRRIARQLHDDLSQRMAIIEIALTKLRQRPADLDRQLDFIIEQISALSEELRSLSHTLHSSVLEHLGLEAGLHSLCAEFERTYNVAIRCLYLSNGRFINLATATVFYRIAQEALRNVVKHAGDARVIITLEETESELRMTIQDDGCGFQQESGGHRGARVHRHAGARQAGGRTRRYTFFSRPGHDADRFCPMAGGVAKPFSGVDLLIQGARNLSLLYRKDLSGKSRKSTAASFGAVLRIITALGLISAVGRLTGSGPHLSISSDFPVLLPDKSRALSVESVPQAILMPLHVAFGIAPPFPIGGDLMSRVCLNAPR